MITVTAKAAAAADGKSFTITWTPSSTERLAEFLIHYRKKGVASWSTVRVSAAARSQLLEVAPGEYEWQVRAVEAGGLASGTVTVAAPVVQEGPTLMRTADESGVVVSAVPAAAVAVNFAQMKDTSATGIIYTPKGVRVGATFTPQSITPVVDAIGVDAAGKEVGVWQSSLPGHSRITTVPIPTPTPTPEPPAPAGMRWLGLHGGNWGSQAPIDIGGMGVKRVRLPSGRLSAEAAGYKAQGFEIIGIFGEGGSLGSLAAGAAGYAEGVAEAAVKYDLLAVEVTNEWGGNWFWSDAGNIPAMRSLIKATREAIDRVGHRAKVLGSFDGGKGGNEGVSFGERAHAEGVFAPCHGVTVHPYGGSSGGNGGGGGDRHKCLRAIEVTGLDLWVTELGWPTGTGSTGDSQSWSEAQQAASYASFIVFFEATPRFVCLIFYGYKNTSDSGADQYGVEMHDSSRHKPAFAVLGNACKALAAKQAMLPALAGMLECEMPPVDEQQPGTEEFAWGLGEKLTPHQLADRAHASMR